MIIQLHPKTEEIVLDRIRKQLTVKRENAVSFSCVPRRDCFNLYLRN